MNKNFEKIKEEYIKKRILFNTEEKLDLIKYQVIIDETIDTMVQLDKARVFESENFSDAIIAATHLLADKINSKESYDPAVISFVFFLIAHHYNDLHERIDTLKIMQMGFLEIYSKDCEMINFGQKKTDENIKKLLAHFVEETFRFKTAITIRRAGKCYPTCQKCSYSDDILNCPLQYEKTSKINGLNYIQFLTKEQKKDLFIELDGYFKPKGITVLKDFTIKTKDHLSDDDYEVYNQTIQKYIVPYMGLDLKGKKIEGSVQLKCRESKDSSKKRDENE